MATYRKTGAGKWEVQIARKGVRRSGTFETKSEATRWAHEIEGEILGGKRGAVDKTLGDLMTRYQAEKVPGKGSPHVEERRIDRMLRDDVVMKMKLRDLKSTHLARWRDERLKKVSNSTVARDMATVSAAITVAIKEWKWLDHSPLKDVAAPKAPPGRDRRISDAEIERLLFALGYDYEDKPETVMQRTGAAMLFAIETGMRDGELAGLTMDRVFLDQRYAHLRKQDTKGRVKRDVPLSKEAMRIVRQMGVTDGLVFGLTARQVSATFQRAKRACMILDVTFHDTRHEAITRLSKKLSVLELARMVGHKDLNQLLTYFNESATDLSKKL